MRQLVFYTLLSLLLSPQCVWAERYITPSLVNAVSINDQIGFSSQWQTHASSSRQLQSIAMHSDKPFLEVSEAFRDGIALHNGAMRTSNYEIRGELKDFFRHPEAIIRFSIQW